MGGPAYHIGRGEHMQDNSALGRAMAIVRDLRQRCSWDRAQTRETLRPYLVEEVLELDHALSEGEVGAIRSDVSSEPGNVLMFISFIHAPSEGEGDYPE